MDSQRQFWETWSLLFKQTLDSPRGAGGFSLPWTEALNLWERGLPSLGNEAAQGFYGKLIRQGKTFLRVAEEVARLTAGMPGAAEGDWHGVFDSWINELKSMATNQLYKGDGQLGALPALELPMDTWIRALSSASLFPGDFVQTVKPEGLRQAAAELHDQIGRFLSVPGVGYTREWQEQAQRTARLALGYQRALQEFVQTHGRLGADTIERFSKKLMERAEQGNEITTLREVYDLWVDCGEEAYSAFAFTDEFAEAYAGLVNATVALKHQSQCTVDELAGALNLPTQRGITTVQKRQQELRREISALRAALDAVSNEGVEREVKAIREELAANDLKTLRGDLRAVRSEIDSALRPQVRDAMEALSAMSDKVEAMERRSRQAADGGAPARARASTGTPARGANVATLAPPPTRPRQRRQHKGE